MSPAPKVVFDEATITERVESLGADISSAYPGGRLGVVSLVSGALVFTADLVRAIDLDVDLHVLRVSSAPEQPHGPMRTDIMYAGHIPYEGREILVVCDLISTGVTLTFLVEHIRGRNPRSVRICTLLDRPDERKIDLRPDWAAFSLKEGVHGFMVGYGLGHDGRYCGLRYLAEIPHPPRATDRQKAVSKG
jgi:hypoxanthine phosphoribosyltransferase